MPVQLRLLFVAHYRFGDNGDSREVRPRGARLGLPKCKRPPVKVKQAPLPAPCHWCGSSETQPWRTLRLSGTLFVTVHDGCIRTARERLRGLALGAKTS